MRFNVKKPIRVEYYPRTEEIIETKDVEIEEIIKKTEDIRVDNVITKVEDIKIDNIITKVKDMKIDKVMNLEEILEGILKSKLGEILEEKNETLE